MSIAATKTNKMPDKIKVNGVILVDKPQGMTSQQVVSKVKYLFKSPNHDSKKAGHTGTLDPMATGLLPICLGEATKFSHYQLDADKSIKQPFYWVARQIRVMPMGRLSLKKSFHHLMQRG